MPKIKRKSDDNTNAILLNIKNKGLLDVIYDYLYIIGIWLIRLFYRTKRNVRVNYFITKTSFFNFLKRTKAKYLNAISTEFRKIIKPVRIFAGKIETLEREFTNAGNLTGEFKYQSYNMIFTAIFKNLFIYLKKCFNYITPVVAFVIMIMAFRYYNSITYALKVEYNGENIGYINNETEFFAAEKLMKDRIIHEDYVKPLDTIPRFTLEIVEKDDITPVDELTNKIISASGNTLVEADGLYIDGKFMGAMEKADALLDLFTDLIKKHSTGNPSEKVSFIKKVELKNGLYPVTSVMGFTQISEKITAVEQQERIYVVQKGDVPSTIAQDHNMPYAKLKALNPGIEEKLLIGQKVLISQAVPVLGVKRVVTETEKEEIAFKTEKTKSSSHEVGYSKITTEGQKGIREVIANVTYIDGVQTDREVIESKVIKEPINEKITIGNKKVKNSYNSSSSSSATNIVSSSKDGFMWPVDGGKVTARIWGYPGHTGMDIGTPLGTPVRAAAAGKVVVAKNMVYNYGRYIMIQHDNGLQTLYAHNSQLLVQVGQRVEKGQLIAYSGSSGRSSGPHVHVEVRSNGQYLDPGQFIGYKYNR